MRPHDLLRLKPHARLVADAVPAWVDASLSRTPFVVIRRAHRTDGLIAVGIRGETRAERFPALIPRDSVATVITPESLTAGKKWRSTPRSRLPIFLALETVDRAAAAIDLAWGIGGGAGFELATGHATVSDTSDLDIILRPSPSHTHETLRALRDDLSRLDVRVDPVVEVGQESVALDEWLASPQRVMIKTPHGPRLGAFSW